jgi:hypothetical protein
MSLRHLTLEHIVVIVGTAKLNTLNSALCPHSGNQSSTWGLEWAATTSPHAAHIDWSAKWQQTAFSERCTLSLYMLRTITCLAWHRWFVLRPFIAEARIPSRASPCEILGGRSSNGTGFYLFSEYSSLPGQYHSINTPYPPSSSDCSYEDKQSKTGNLQTK